MALTQISQISESIQSDCQLETCMFDGCQTVPTHELIVDSDELFVVFSICVEHLAVMSADASAERVKGAHRGLKGIRL